jgi:hypothetical protein
MTCSSEPPSALSAEPLLDELTGSRLNHQAPVAQNMFILDRKQAN